MNERFNVLTFYSIGHDFHFPSWSAFTSLHFTAWSPVYIVVSFRNINKRIRIIECHYLWLNWFACWCAIQKQNWFTCWCAIKKQNWFTCWCCAIQTQVCILNEDIPFPFCCSFAFFRLVKLFICFYFYLFSISF